jgi:hypothetical protein
MPNDTTDPFVAALITAAIQRQLRPQLEDFSTRTR